MLAGNIVDELLDENRLAQTGAAVETDLAALDEGGDQVDDLEAGLEDLDCWREVAKGRRVAVDWPALRPARRGLFPVDRVTDDVPEPAQGGLAHRHGDRGPAVDHVRATRQTVGRVHRHRTDAIVAEVLLDLRYEHAG